MALNMKDGRGKLITVRGLVEPDCLIGSADESGDESG